MPPADRFAAVLREWAEVFMNRSMRDSIRVWKDSGLSMPYITTLMRLHYHCAWGISDVGHHLSVTNAAASQMADKLVQQGLVERTEDPNDRRAKQLTLTPKGRALVQKSL